jgi:hypothetical protein
MEPTYIEHLKLEKNPRLRSEREVEEMPRVEIKCPLHSAGSEKMRGLVEQIEKLKETLSFADKITISVADTIYLGSDGDPEPFVCIYSADQEHLDAIGEVLKNLSCNLEFNLLAAYKSAGSKEIQKPLPDIRTIRF